MPRAILAAAIGAALAVSGATLQGIFRNPLADPGLISVSSGTALAPASLLTLADLVVRTVAIPAELPMGVLTAITGGPFFLFLLLRVRRAQGGWA